MYLASVVIPFSQTRLNNLEQILRFFKKEEIAKDCEFLLVCQNSCDKPKINNLNIKLIQINSNEYCRAKMCNKGVSASQSEIIILLDSDRILPTNYFSKNCSSVSSNQCISTQNLWQITHPVTDEDIIIGNYSVLQDTKSTSNEMHKKGMFSGNTVMHKNTYVKLGGMDESFVGYGYQDIDFAKTAISHGLEMIFHNDKELHLHHSKIPPEEVRKSTVWNGIKYCKKWQLTPEPLLIERGLSVGINVIEMCKTITML